jgi:hypothetical protein
LWWSEIDEEDIDEDVDVDEALEQVRRRGEFATASCILLNITLIRFWWGC